MRPANFRQPLQPHPESAPFARLLAEFSQVRGCGVRSVRAARPRPDGVQPPACTALFSPSRSASRLPQPGRRWCCLHRWGCRRGPRWFRGRATIWRSRPSPRATTRRPSNSPSGTPPAAFGSVPTAGSTRSLRRRWWATACSNSADIARRWPATRNRSTSRRPTPSGCWRCSFRSSRSSRSGDPARPPGGGANATRCRRRCRTE